MYDPAFYRIISKRKNSGRLVASANRVDVFFHSSNRYIKIDSKIEGVCDEMNVTIYDVAREANVSMATVSRVVNGNPNVKPTTRKKVLEAIDRLGYRPNAVARGLASKKTTTVGVIIPDISNTFYAELARGIEDIATMYKYNIILSNSDQNKEKEFHLLNTMLGKQVDGIVFMGEDITDIHIEEFKSLQYQSY